MNKSRLLKLAGLLERDARNKTGVKFDFDNWGTSERLKAFTKVDCQTAACAIGLACISGAFKRAGLDFEIEEDGNVAPFIPNPHKAWDPFAEAKLYGYDAAQKVFDIESNEAKFLFAWGSYPAGLRKGALAERAVAKRLRDFVAGKTAPRSR